MSGPRIGTLQGVYDGPEGRPVLAVEVGPLIELLERMAALDADSYDHAIESVAGDAELMLSLLQGRVGSQ